MHSLEVKNCLRTKGVVFVVVFGEKPSSKSSISSLFLFVRIAYILLYCLFFSCMEKKALKMRRTRVLANYADPHHRILSDALQQQQQWENQF